MKKILFLAAAFLAHIALFACTTFFINKNGQLVFGRNYDWITDAGMVYTNLRGMAKTSMPTGDGTTISWTSLYGSITFNQYGKEFPTGGMNEKGLVVELMWLDETKYPAADDRPAIGVLQWIQYQLDNCSTIEEVIATDKKLRIASIGTTPLHYLVADAAGNAATIEFLDGKIVVHKGKELVQPVLTNSVYAESVKYQDKAANISNASFEYGNNSLERFGKACSKIREYRNGASNVAAVDFAFNILDEVSQGDHTKWSIVYDLTNKSIHFKTNRYREVKSVKFSAFDFSCEGSSKAFNINQTGKGDMNKKFEVYDYSINQKLVETSFRESSTYIKLGEETRAAVALYPNSITCK
jgi:penicillin V acylase-like amidase (Ntn superfamily)